MRRLIKKLNSQLTVGSLNKWNFSLAGLYAVQGIVILILSNIRTFSVTTNYLAIDPLQSKGAGHTVTALATRHLFDINLAYLIAIIFFISAIAHSLLATIYRPQYEADLDKGINKVRWIEYAFSSSLMIIAIALLVGVSDLSTLVMLFGLTAIMSLAGLLMELYNRSKHSLANRGIYWLGCLSGLIPWIVIAIYLLSSGIYGSAAPAFVYGIFASLLVLFGCFALNIYLQNHRWKKWKNYLHGERVYMILSLVAKTALAWQIFAGTLRP